MSCMSCPDAEDRRWDVCLTAGASVWGRASNAWGIPIAAITDVTDSLIISSNRSLAYP